MEFARPDLLYLLLLLPVWWLLVWPRAGRGVVFARGDAARRLSRWWGAPSALVLALPRLLRAAAMAALVLALADPQRVETRQESSIEGKGIGLIVDLSSSMLATDMEDGASRIEVAREAGVRFAQGRPYDELNLVAFAGRALTRVPPTMDPGLIVAGVQSLDIEIVGDGTDISSALLTSLHQLEESEREQRVIVLLTDGGHNGTGVRPLAAARAAAALGVRVHSISVAAEEDPAVRAARVAARRALGNADADMGTVLTAISEVTGGQYFRATTGAGLDSAYREIGRLEAPVVKLNDVEVRRSERLLLLVAALALLGLDVLLRGSRWGVVP